MKVLPIAYQKQWGVNYSINDKRRDFMSDNNKKVEEKAAEIIQATETQTVKPAAAEDKEFKKKKSTTWERNQRKWGWAFILPTMIGIIVLNLWPIVQTIYQSFCKVGSFGDSSFAGFANYKKMFADPEVWQSLLNTFKYAIIGVWSIIGYNMVLFLAGLQEIPKDYYEAADIDGASGVRAFFKITLPLLSPTVFFVLVTRVIGALQVFDLVYMVMDISNPALKKTESIVYLFYQYSFQNGNKGYGSAIVVLLLAVIMVLTVFQMIGQKKWVHYN